MPKMKRTTTEVQEIDQQQPESPPTYANEDIFDHLDKLHDTDFVQGSNVKLAYYVYQDQPAVTKKEGESAYAKIFSQRFTHDDLRALNPMATRWKIIEKVMGDRTSRKTFYVAMMPAAAAPAAAMPMLGVGQPSEMGQALKTVVDLAADRTGVQREAMKQSMDVMGEAYKRGIEMMPRSSSIADELGKLKTAGLLNMGNGNGFGFAEVKVLLEWGLPKLKELGIIGSPEKTADPKKEFERLVEMIDVIETRFGKAAKGSDQVWPMVFQTFGPSVVKLVDNITLNIPDIFRAKAAMSGNPLPERPAQQPVAEVMPSQPGQQPPTTSPNGQPSAQDYIKMRFVVLCRQELEEETPEAENIAKWLEMTCPQLAELLAKTPEDGVMQFLSVDSILKEIGMDEKSMSLKKAVYAELVKDAKQSEPASQ